MKRNIVFAQAAFALALSAAISGVIPIAADEPEEPAPVTSEPDVQQTVASDPEPAETKTEDNTQITADKSPDTEITQETEQEPIEADVTTTEGNVETNAVSSEIQGESETPLLKETEEIPTGNSSSLQATEQLPVLATEEQSLPVEDVSMEITYSAPAPQVVQEAVPIILMSPVAQPATLHVSDTGDDSVTYGEGAVYASMQAAINAAQNGDTIHIDGPLTLTSEVSIQRKTVTLESGDTTVKRGASLLTAMFNLTSGANVTMQHLIVDGNGSEVTANESAIKTYQSTLSLNEGAKVINNKTNTSDWTNYFYAGGITADDSSTLNINGGEVTGNKTNSVGGGITVNDGSAINITSGKISDNTSSDGGGGIHVNTDSSITMTGGEISGNSVTMDGLQEGAGAGGGISVNVGSTGIISGGSITGNSAVYGGGIDVVSASRLSTVTLSGNASVLGNTATTGGGGAIAWLGGVLNLKENASIEDNTANNGGAAWVSNDGVMNIMGGTVSGNSAGAIGGIDLSYAGTLNMNGGLITKNTVTGGNTGGVYIGAASTANIVGGTITKYIAKQGKAITLAGTALNLGDPDITGDIFLNRGKYVTLVKKSEKKYLINTKVSDREDGRIVVVPGSKEVSGKTYTTDDAEPMWKEFSHVSKGIVPGSQNAISDDDSKDLILAGYRITFDTVIEEAGDIDPRNGNFNDPVSGLMPADPSASGYIFDGWYLDSGYTEKVPADMLLKENVTMYAKWSKKPEVTPVPEAAQTEEKEKTWCVTFLDCKGNTISVQWVKQGGSAVAPAGYGTYTGYTDVTSHRDLRSTTCEIKAKDIVPNTLDNH